ncbi:hypothetical protein AB0O82_06265 [Kitasatospora sp. NPDC088264]|uniref:hypothetical protein n=1 Tax=Kitasatospora sp. NPDC088264 TaxID=3155296 RepID=UPI0034129822
MKSFSGGVACRPPMSRVRRGGRAAGQVRQCGEPDDRGEAGQEAVLAAAHGHEPGQPGEPAADRAGRDGVHTGAAAVADQRVLLGAEAGEVAVVEPHLLHELELPGQAGAHEDEDDPALRAVVLQGRGRQQRTVRRAAPQHPVDAGLDHGVRQAVPRIGPPDVRAARDDQAPRVVVVAEVVVARRIGAKVRIVVLRRQCQRPTILAASSSSSSGERAWSRRYLRDAATSARI